MQPRQTPFPKHLAIALQDETQRNARDSGRMADASTMSREALPPAVKQLLARHIRSVEQLEVLLLLRSQPARAWKSADVYDVIRSSASSISARLDAFAAAGFLAKEEGLPATYRYAPKADLRSAVEETAAAYQTWRIRVIEAIFAPESDPVQNFADAFKLRKE